MRWSTLTLAIVVHSSLSAAWPWPPSLGDLSAILGRRLPEPIVDEQDLWLRADKSTSSAATDDNEAKSTLPQDNNGPTSTFPQETGTATGSGTESGKHTTGSHTGKATATSGGKSGSGTAPMTSAATIPINAAAGGISMLTPVQTTATYAKIGDPITFVWNYTSLLAPPSYVDVIASNTDGVWTITSNMTVKETGSVVWNTSNEATPLPMESYTFVVYDADTDVTAVPSPGHLSPYLGYQFAMYSPKPYVASDDFVCVTCNAGITSMERQSLTVLLGTCMLTVLSFTYFSCGFLGVI